MVKRGPWSRPQASEGEAQHGPFCRNGRIGQGEECLNFGGRGQDREGSEGGERASSTSEGSGESRLPLQADRTGSRAVVAMAIQRSGRTELPVICVETRHMQAVLKAISWRQRHGSRFAYPPIQRQPFALPFGNSNTRHVVVACASSRSFASVMRASAVATRRPALSTRPSVRITPLVSLMPRTNEILNSSVV